MMTATVSPLKPRSTDKRAEVLDIASENFRIKGFDGTSINVMAREAGISKESIYRYFGSKEDLFLAVIERELAVYRQSMIDTGRHYQGKSLREALCMVADATLRVASDDRTLALRRLIFQMSANGSKVGEHYFTAGPEIANQNLQRLFEHYKPNSTFTTDKLSRYFVSMVLHRTMLRRECGIQAPLTDDEIKQSSAAAVEDFLLAFCKGAQV
ncbi:MAG: TetR/AcrR family transcriptional regulator [Pseudomonadales bacterium]|jgi:TetR/AcrR family transcriptional repressor of mexJK operon|nr:TetR/AcrR family transcriptional regulator [Pseudomonadales bacterium]